MNILLINKNRGVSGEYTILRYEKSVNLKDEGWENRFSAQFARDEVRLFRFVLFHLSGAWMGHLGSCVIEMD